MHLENNFNVQEVERLAAKIGKMKNEIAPVDKIVRSDSKKLKDLMIKFGKQEVEKGGYKAVLHKSTKFSFDQAKLVAILKNLGHTEIIRVEEWVDEQALEKLVFSGEINAKDLAAAQIKSEDYTLNFKKTLEEKEDERDLVF